MTSLAYGFFPIFFLIALGAVLGKKGVLSVEMIEGLKTIVASIALPAVLFGAFSRVQVDARLGALALAIYAACALMGLIGWLGARRLRMPAPSTTFLFQGFEAGMLGYGLYIALFGQASVSFLATADLGQVVFVFTALMTQLRRAETGGPIRPLLLVKNMLLSPVIISIITGLLASVAYPDASGSPWAEHGALSPLLASLGALTTPLICLVVGFGLRDFRIRGAGPAVAFVTFRLAVAIIVGTGVALVAVNILGFPRQQAVAVVFLFVLPPPFVIPVFRTATNDASYISSVLSIHTLVSIAATVILAALAGAAVT